ncbi:hypothetical protein [Plantibacter sp. ME-Dv--P-095]|uniref:hypothetical protein n=1 Tax=Plantibacter sp. ME-Dv--P-095 TaxID=3040299 RepID=UPI00254F382F|nr:hypothetical protein [Plantibacter sp. ME-Dv--P-095]
MDLEELLRLPLDDQVTMLVGVSVRHAVELEAAVRSVLMTIDSEFDPSRRWKFSELITVFRRQSSTSPQFSKELRKACAEIASEALDGYNRRNTNAHDMLGTYAGTPIERFRFERDHSIAPDDEPEILSVADLVQHCTDLEHAIWRLRGVMFYLARPEDRRWWGMLVEGNFEARWDGSASRTTVLS